MSKHFDIAKHSKICCEVMAEQLEDFRFPIDMDPTVRRYFIPYMWPHSGVFTIDFCPWCATPLPTLEIKRKEILNKEYGITDDRDETIPDEFFSEEWWVKRSL